MNMRKILLAVDGSEPSAKAAGQAADLAALTGASVILFTCIPLLEGGDQPFFDPNAPKELEAEAEALLAPGKALLSGRGISFSARHIQGDPAREIAAAAEAEACDLIVMGSRGLGKVMGLILGSVTKAVVQSAPCSVWVVR